MQYIRRPKETLHRRHGSIDNQSFQDQYGNLKGLADGLTVSWPPSGVSRRWHRHANATFVALVIVFVCVCVTDFALTVRARLSPPVSLSRNAAATQLNMPNFTVCRPLLLRGNDEANWGDWQGIPYTTQVRCVRTARYDAGGTPADDGAVRHRINITTAVEQQAITTFTGDRCDIISIKNGIDIDINKDLRYEIQFDTRGNDTYDWASYYVSDKRPWDAIDWNANEVQYDFGAVKMGNHYRAKITKQRDIHLNCTHGGLSCAPTTSDSYSAEVTMLATETKPDIVVFDFTSDALGLMILEEQDPVDWLNLVSNAYSYLGYCLAAFTLLFSCARTARLRELEEAKTLHILKQHLATVQQRALTECYAPVDTVDARQDVQLAPCV
ncbi:hypothetical protein JKP88DRAFT_280711 [Tribonema minus]|uniref:Uncharacterized protein n=1 Tax=Tribonema minus TaxID=303371 RepID=A0A835YRY4_9STRA|nr:hypothetical protein JKP88DRAFT_280711 [Tribonema minus]